MPSFSETAGLPKDKRSRNPALLCAADLAASGRAMSSLPVSGFLLVLWAAAVFAFLLRVDRFKLVVFAMVLTAIVAVLLWRGRPVPPATTPAVVVLRGAVPRLVDSEKGAAARIACWGNATTGFLV